MSDVDYRPICSLAIASLVLAAMSALAFIVPALTLLAAVSLLVACDARRTIRDYQLRGSRVIGLSLCLAAAVFVLAPTWHIGIHWRLMQKYAAESLPEHERLDFAELLESKKSRLDDFENRAICLKGYFVDDDSAEVSPGVKLSASGKSKDEKAITVIAPSRRSVDDKPVAVSGVLSIDRRVPHGPRRYILRASEIRESNTPIGLAPRYVASGFGSGGC